MPCVEETLNGNIMPATTTNQTEAHTAAHAPAPLQASHDGPHWLQFWAPLLLIVISVMGTTHDERHAIQAAGEKVADHDEVESAGANTLSRQLSILVLGGVGAVLLMSPSSRRARYRHMGLLLTLLGYMALSVIWSGTPFVTVKRVMIPALLFLAACGIGRQWRPVDFCLAAVCMSSVFLIVGIAAEVHYGTFFANDEHRFSGLLHMNRQAMNCGVLVLSSVALSIIKKKPWILLIAAGGFYMLLATKSRGGLAAVVSAGLFFWWMSTPAGSRWTVAGACAALLGGAMMYAGLTGNMGVDWSELATLGRQDPGADATTLTGRIPIWLQVIDSIREQPVLGYGYGGFWTPKRVLYFSYIHNWAFSNAHSIYLESMLNLGIAGFSIGLAATAAIFLRGVKLYRESRDPGLLLILSLVVMGAVSGLTEAIFVSIGYTLILVLTGFCMICYQPVQRREQRDETYSEAMGQQRTQAWQGVTL